MTIYIKYILCILKRLSTLYMCNVYVICYSIFVYIYMDMDRGLQLIIFVVPAEYIIIYVNMYNILYVHVEKL